MSSQPADVPNPPATTRGIALGVVVVIVLAAVALILFGGTRISGANSGMLVMIPAAFLAGIFSFLSPCTLPILPAYFAFTFQTKRERVVLMTIAFFLGLATTMVVLGASATALSKLLFRNLSELQVVGGWIIIAFGVMSLLGKGFTGANLLNRPSTNIVGSYLYGATFALGWTACVGPILGALLTMLATQGAAVLQGAFLAFIYALGLGTPLILVATFFSRVGQGSAAWRLLRGRSFSLNLGFTTLHLHSTSILSGLLLIGMGWLLASGQLTAITQWGQATPFAQWSITIEQWIESIFVP